MNISPLTDACRELAISSFTVGLRCSSGTVTSDRNGSRSWLSSGTALCAKITERPGSIPIAR